MQYNIFDIEPQLINWYHHIHSYPEIGYNEFKTSQYIYDQLSKIPDIIIKRFNNNTSVVAKISGKNKGKNVAFRTEIDALPINEENDLEWKSKIKGVMHSCGHDGHIAILLGIANVISNLKNQFDGEVTFIFQHAEETPPGGAKDLIKLGILDNIDEIYGAHLDVFLPVGFFKVSSGAIMAGTYDLSIKIFGNGGHAAFPHQSTDTVYVAANIITQLHGLISRGKDPIHRALLTITQIQASSAVNIIPSEVIMKGTIRILDRDCIGSLFEKINNIVKYTCAAYNLDACIDINENYPILENDEKQTQIVKHALQQELGNCVFEDKPVMGGEDFGAYLNITSGCYYKIGAKPETNEKIYPYHHSKFKFNEDALKIGVRAGVAVILNALKK